MFPEFSSSKQEMKQQEKKQRKGSRKSPRRGQGEQKAKKRDNSNEGRWFFDALVRSNNRMTIAKREAVAGKQQSAADENSILKSIA